MGQVIVKWKMGTFILSLLIAVALFFAMHVNAIQPSPQAM